MQSFTQPTPEEKIYYGFTEDYSIEEPGALVYTGAILYNGYKGIENAFVTTGTYIGTQLGIWDVHGWSETDLGKTYNDTRGWLTDELETTLDGAGLWESETGQGLSHIGGFAEYLADNLTVSGAIDNIGVSVDYVAGKAQSAWNSVTNFFGSRSGLEIAEDLSYGAGTLLGDAAISPTNTVGFKLILVDKKQHMSAGVLAHPLQQKVYMYQQFFTLKRKLPQRFEAKNKIIYFA